MPNIESNNEKTSENDSEKNAENNCSWVMRGATCKELEDFGWRALMVLFIITLAFCCWFFGQKFMARVRNRQRNRQFVAQFPISVIEMRSSSLSLPSYNTATLPSYKEAVGNLAK